MNDLSDNLKMALNTLIANPGRLRILTALAVEQPQEFVRLRELTRMTDGNLSAHAQRLGAAGMISIEKSFRDGKPVTTFQITSGGRDALEAHARYLLAAIGEIDGSLHSAAVDDGESDLVAAAQPANERDDWVD